MALRLSNFCHVKVKFNTIEKILAVVVYLRKDDLDLINDIPNSSKIVMQMVQKILQLQFGTIAITNKEDLLKTIKKLKQKGENFIKFEELQCIYDLTLASSMYTVLQAGEEKNGELLALRRLPYTLFVYLYPSCIDIKELRNTFVDNDDLLGVDPSCQQ